MPNIFVPFDLGVKDLTTKSAILTWDLNNVAEYKAGTYYKVYLSDNGTTFTEPAIVANIRTLSVPLKANEFWFAVTSIVDGLESVKSSPFKVAAKLGMSDSRDTSTVAIDINGNPCKLKVNANGELMTSANFSVGNISVALSGMATEVKQDAQITIAEATRLDLIAEISNLTGVVNGSSSAIITSINTNSGIIAAKLDAIQSATSSSNKPTILSAETTLSNVTSAGITVYIPWKKRAIIDRITVIREAGSATSWKIEILNKNAPVTARNVIMREFSYNSYDVDRFDVLRTFSFINLDGADLIGIRLTPDTGTSNIFYVAITGTEAQ